ncbi:hypothetical protein P280DRAFT_489424 [Massarina eburnea CBS 473.64]|uniref:Uncharacterized protein n=1 Tax=Massarina eburnea CBS 473.64 TaxID=1395130 RepID=A0A6A6S4B8_9PLEO|nr:hypothetical protein P280DRAFT_489424 [Massarina eburnea CBS 473.64]
MFSKTFAVLALATGFAAGNDISLNNNVLGGNGIGGNQFSFIDGFQNFQQQQQVIQVQQENFQLVQSNGVQQQVFQQVNQVLVVDNQQNGFNNQLNNLFRQANFRNGNRGVTTVMMVVTQVNVAVDDGRGNQLQQQVFAQSLIVANRGQRVTQSVMIFDSRTLIAADIIGAGGIGAGIAAQGQGVGIAGIGGANGVAGASATGTAAAAAAMPTKTRGVQLLASKPTWSSVAEDPAATQGAAWQAEIQDLQRADQDAGDNDVNNDVAKQEMEAQMAAAEQVKQGEEAKQEEKPAEGEEKAE